MKKLQSNLSKHNYLFYLLLAVALLGSVAYWIFFVSDEKELADMEESTAAETISTDMETYTFREVSRMISALAGDDEVKREELDRLVDPLYFSNPINALYISQVASTLGLENAVYTDILFGTDMDAPVSKQQFDIFYQRILDSGKIEGIERTTIYLKQVIDDTTISDGYQNYAIAEFIYESKYLGKIVSVYKWNDVIFKIASLSDASITYRNVWISAETEDRIYFCYQGKVDSIKKEGYSGGSVKCGVMADLTFNNNGIQTIDNRIQVNGKVESLTDDSVKLNGKVYQKAEDFTVCNVTVMDEKVQECIRLEQDGEAVIDRTLDEERVGLVSEAMLVNSSSVDAVIVDEKVEMIFLREDNLARKDIRVLIHNDEKTDLYYQTLSFTCDESFVVSINGAATEYAAGEEVSFTASETEKGIIRIRSLKKDGLVICSSILRRGMPAEYAGVLEIRREKEGLVLIDQVPLETYLISVVSELISEEAEEETIRAMTILARTYAYASMKNMKYPDYRADLDDSELCQHYMFSEEKRAAIRAIYETYGEVVLYEGQPVEAAYYLTSAGVTNSNADIWDEEEQAYFVPHYETQNMEQADLSDEAIFAAFLGNSNGLDTLEKNEPFYRWSIVFSKEELSRGVNEQLKLRTGDDASSEVPNKNEEDDDSVIGEIQNIEVTKRGRGGNVLELVITGSKAAAQITGQSHIRMIFSPKEETISLRDGSTRTGWDAFPSTSFYVRVKEDEVSFHGGGFGSGVGLSQRGADILARQGKTGEEILQHYYKDSDCENLYQYQETDNSEKSAEEATETVENKTEENVATEEDKRKSE